jgi:DNA uptake protein ComE-like DNA-binding protein
LLKQLRSWIVSLLALTALAIAGCGLVQSDSRTDEEKRAASERTRDEVAKATERAKPELEKAGRELKQAARTAAEQAHAAAQGVRDGWTRGGHSTIDLNSASEQDLRSLPGVTTRDARRIIQARPYRSPHDLIDKGVVSRETYAQIRDRVSAD